MDMLCCQRMAMREASRRPVFMDLWYHRAGSAVVR
jgi:hypothetical protein